jgi:hypothetical protein
VTSFKITQRQVLILMNIEFGGVAHIVMQQVVIKIDALTEKIVVFLWFKSLKELKEFLLCMGH